MIQVSVIFLLLMLMGKSIDSGSTGDLEADWDELFGHLTHESTPSTLPMESPSSGKHGHSKISGSKEVPKLHGNKKNSTNTVGSIKPRPPPAPPATPFVYNPEHPGKLPNVGAQSQGSMEGIAISQNGATSVAMFIMNSSYNSFSTLFGSSQGAHTQARVLNLAIT